MRENYVSSTKMGMVAAWTLVLVMIVGSWGVCLLAPEHWRVGGLLAATACVMACVAGTLSIKIYAARQCALIRAVSGLDDADDSSRANVLSMR